MFSAARVPYKLLVNWQMLVCVSNHTELQECGCCLPAKSLCEAIALARLAWAKRTPGRKRSERKRLVALRGWPDDRRLSRPECQSHRFIGDWAKCKTSPASTPFGGIDRLNRSKNRFKSYLKAWRLEEGHYRFGASQFVSPISKKEESQVENQDQKDKSGSQE